MSKLIQDCKDAIPYLNDIGGSMRNAAATLESAIERLEEDEKTRRHKIMDYSSPLSVMESGARAFNLGLSKSECPINSRTHANAIHWWNDGWNNEATCPECRGSGKKISSVTSSASTCEYCKGMGKVMCKPN